MDNDKEKEKKTNKKIQNMIKNPDISSDEIIQFVKQDCQAIHLKPATLGMLFEMYVGIDYDSDDEFTFFSEAVEIEELKKIHPEFATSNGSTWARSDVGYLGKKYKIVREKSGNSTSSVRLDGPNKNSVKKHRHIKGDIKSKISRQRCRILDVGSNIEVDHKNGMYDDLSNISLENQDENNFQPLSKAANDAKREHCKKCRKDGKRYDARRLGYKEGWVVGDENTKDCTGCYWYDPKKFNKLISNNFDKKR